MSDTKKFDLAYALKLAEYWHRNQFIGHLSFVEEHTKPVIENVACALTNEDPVYDQQLLIVAALHDIIDNSDCPLSELDCFGATIKEAVKAISKHSPNESLDRYLARISTNKLAFMVKGQEALVNLERALLTRSPKDTRKYSELLARLFEIVEGKSPAAKEHNADNANLEDALEAAFWNFDARCKGYSKYAGARVSERDAFKAEVRNLLSVALNVKTTEDFVRSVPFPIPKIAK